MTFLFRLCFLLLLDLWLFRLRVLNNVHHLPLLYNGLLYISRLLLFLNGLLNICRLTWWLHVVLVLRHGYSSLGFVSFHLDDLITINDIAPSDDPYICRDWHRGALTDLNASLGHDLIPGLYIGLNGWCRHIVHVLWLSGVYNVCRLVLHWFLVIGDNRGNVLLHKLGFLLIRRLGQNISVWLRHVLYVLWYFICDAFVVRICKRLAGYWLSSRQRTNIRYRALLEIRCKWLVWIDRSVVRHHLLSRLNICIGYGLLILGLLVLSVGLCNRLLDQTRFLWLDIISGCYRLIVRLTWYIVLTRGVSWRRTWLTSGHRGLIYVLHGLRWSIRCDNLLVRFVFSRLSFDFGLNDTVLRLHLFCFDSHNGLGRYIPSSEVGNDFLCAWSISFRFDQKLNDLTK